MAIKRKPQTEAKAKGLVGWKNGRQVTTSKDSSANKNVGDYKGRTLNLSKKQLGASGRRAASARTVDIGKTTFDKSKGGVLGPGGKPLTGRVDLGGGNIAVYKQGVRVRAAASKPKGGNGGGGGGNGGGGDGPPKKKYGTPYEERKAAIGSGTTKGKPRGAGVPYEERKQAIGGGNARPRTKMQEAARANPYLGGRGRAVQKQKDGSYSTASGNKGTTARAALLARKAQDKKNESRDNTLLASLALAPLLAAGGVAGGAGAGLRGVMAARGGAAARAAAARTSAPAARAALPKAMTRPTPTGAARAKEIAAAASKSGVKVKPSTKVPTKPQYVGNSSRNTGRAGEIERGLRAGLSKPSLTPAQKAARTRAANKAKKEGKK